MKYTTSIRIERPVDKVIELFDNVDNMKKWMDGLQSFEPISGTPGEVGSKAKLVFKMGKREVEMIETVTVRNFPHEFSGTYEAKGVFNVVKNKFEETAEGHTIYNSENEFQFKGFMRLIAFLMPGAFKKQSVKYLQDFKRFAESEA